MAVSLRFMNFGANPPSDEGILDTGMSSFVENPQYFCGIIKDKDMCKWKKCFETYLQLYPKQMVRMECMTENQ